MEPGGPSVDGTRFWMMAYLLEPHPTPLTSNHPRGHFRLASSHVLPWNFMCYTCLREVSLFGIPSSPSNRPAVNLPFFVAALLVLGLGGIVAQTVLLRELLILFSGNELSLGVIIGFWVVAEAVGAFTGSLLSRGRLAGVGSFVSLTVVFSLIFPATIYLTRIFKPLCGIPVEMGVGIVTIFYASFLILLPVGFIHGFLFTLSCALLSQFTGRPFESPGRVYYYETLGTIAGGICVNYLLIPYLHSFQIALALALINGIVCLTLLPLPSRRSHSSPFLVPGSLVLVSGALLLSGGADRLQEASIGHAWQGKKVLHYENSLYQNIAVMGNEDQITVFGNGTPLVSSPVPDIVFVEEFAHFSLLSHFRPRDILILGGGAGGIINEVLKHPSVDMIDYVEIDPALLGVIRRYASPLILKELTDPRVRLHYRDGRLFVRDAARRYDVILLGVPPPSTLERNRFYTQEFFDLARGVLKEDGVFALTFPGTLAYYSRELRDLNAQTLATLKRSFPGLFVIPGDTNIYLASTSAAIADTDADLLFKRLAERDVRTNLITEFHLSDRLAPRWRDWFSSSLAGVELPLNRDFHPSAVFCEIAYENLLFSPALKGLFQRATQVSPLHAMVVILILTLVMLAWSARSPGIALPFALATTGFAGMVSELALVFAFQVLYGYVFYEIALLITAFMGGAAFGSLIITRRLPMLKRNIRTFLVVEGATVLFLLLLWAIFLMPHTGHPSSPLMVHAMVLFLLFLSGLFTGLEFPLATQVYQSAHSVENNAGILYAADLFGGWIGGVLSGFLLLPMLGLSTTCLLLALVKAGSFLVVARTSKKMYTPGETQ